jgi:Ankyrin repeats (3 copies)
VTPVERDYLNAIEVHSVEELEKIIESGFNVKQPIDGKLPIDWLVEMYFRSDHFPDCMRILLRHGAVWEDPFVLPVLLNDIAGLGALLDKNPNAVSHRTNMVSCFTPLLGATLLHVAAEYGHLQTARLLIEKGADVNAAADQDAAGLNGHTALFHTVNSWNNRSLPVMELLVQSGARCDIRLAGITWGKGFEWETTVFDVTPISYCQFGLLRQFQRTEQDIYQNIRYMLNASGRGTTPINNVPNRYLQT